MLQHLIILWLSRDSAQRALSPQLYSILWLEMTQTVEWPLSPALLNPFHLCQLSSELVPISQSCLTPTHWGCSRCICQGCWFSGTPLRFVCSHLAWREEENRYLEGLFSMVMA